MNACARIRHAYRFYRPQPNVKVECIGALRHEKTAQRFEPDGKGGGLLKILVEYPPRPGFRGGVRKYVVRKRALGAA